MKSKLTLSINKATIEKAKNLAKKRDSTVSQMVEDYIEHTSRVEEKLRAKEKISGIIDANLAANEEVEYSNEVYKKHGWE